MRSKEFRNDPLFLRNGYQSEGKYNFPIVRKQEIELNNVELIAYSDISRTDTKNLHKGVHYFVDDWRFESTYNHPKNPIDNIAKYRFVLTPDFSLYAEMPLWRQIESVGKSRWVGAYWQENGLCVVPTVSWSTSVSYDFCFKSIEHGSIVGIGMIGCKQSFQSFMKGYDEMLRQIQPEAIICFGEPYDEMGGNIFVVDYSSSRKVVR